MSTSRHTPNSTIHMFTEHLYRDGRHWIALVLSSIVLGFLLQAKYRKSLLGSAYQGKRISLLWSLPLWIFPPITSLVWFEWTQQRARANELAVISARSHLQASNLPVTNAKPSLLPYPDIRGEQQRRTSRSQRLISDYIRNITVWVQEELV